MRTLYAPLLRKFLVFFFPFSLFPGVSSFPKWPVLFSFQIVMERNLPYMRQYAFWIHTDPSPFNPSSTGISAGPCRTTMLPSGGALHVLRRRSSPQCLGDGASLCPSPWALASQPSIPCGGTHCKKTASGTEPTTETVPPSKNGFPRKKVRFSVPSSVPHGFSYGQDAA